MLRELHKRGEESVAAGDEKSGGAATRTQSLGQPIEPWLPTKISHAIVLGEAAQGGQ
jgi:hypothetical protein